MEQKGRWGLAESIKSQDCGASSCYPCIAPKGKPPRVASVANDNDGRSIDHGEENRRWACDDAWPVVSLQYGQI